MNTIDRDTKGLFLLYSLEAPSCVTLIPDPNSDRPTFKLASEAIPKWTKLAWSTQYPGSLEKFKKLLSSIGSPTVGVDLNVKVLSKEQHDELTRFTDSQRQKLARPRTKITLDVEVTKQPDGTWKPTVNLGTHDDANIDELFEPYRKEFATTNKFPYDMDSPLRAESTREEAQTFAKHLALARLREALIDERIYIEDGGRSPQLLSTTKEATTTRPYESQSG
ncbi:hypothetical protein M231_03669 [Tremella mesenterica]|uniref:Uncharacterized protein n=1 Tax=Tremella mesenterica TaxID=5217 RepID=A0A4Q1BMI2_TREME|nr:hypothetical protein M231_03669 [Tremella mesenterica]